MKRRGLKVRSAGLALSVLFAASCGSASDPAGGISSQPLSGKIGGRPWTFRNGWTFNVPSSEIYQVWAAGTPFTPCTSEFSYETDLAILSVPKKAGSYDLSLMFSQTLANGVIDESYFVFSGKLVVESITPPTIKGSAKFAYDADNYVDGTFEATICQ